MKPSFFLLGIPTLAILLPSIDASARPEYATKEKLNCVSCHASPWGGGPRNLMGKAYGSHGHDPAKTSASDLYYASDRFIGYYSTEETAKHANGLGLMEASVSGNVPIVQSANGSEMRGVLTYNMPSLTSAGPREAYLRWQLPARPGVTPTHVVVGRFYVPFGYLTDEHRTYARIQTNMTYNNFDVGAALSTNPLESLHLDLALVSGFQNGGTFNSGELPWGVVGNMRWNPESLPFLLGLSGNFERTLNQPQPVAGSLYSVLSADRLTGDKLSGSIVLEGVLARNWNNPSLNTGLVNPGLGSFFIPPSNSTYLPSVATASSLGILGQAKLNLTHVWTLLYRLDYLAPDTASLSTHFTRHGFGFEAYLNSNLIWNLRYEMAGYPDFLSSAGNTALGLQPDIFSMLRVWL